MLIILLLGSVEAQLANWARLSTIAFDTFANALTCALVRLAERPLDSTQSRKTGTFSPTLWAMSR
ncbi:MAG TPA: hypothetical protein VGI79_13595 [Caulobacteraceae bacterium]